MESDNGIGHSSFMIGNKGKEGNVNSRGDPST